MMSIPPRLQTAPRKGGGWKVTAIILALLLGLSFLIHFSDFLGAFSAGAMAGQSRLEETIIENNDSENKIAVIPVEGIIASFGSDLSPQNMVRLIGDQLKLAARDESVKAVLLKVDSPGGEVLASDDIYNLIAKFQKEHDKPVVAAMGSLAASGGYYVSAPCQWIVANELTITGSIGVIMQTYNFRGLMNKVGVRPLVFKSGRFKDMLSSSKDLDQMTPTEQADLAEEEAMMKKMIAETFGKFKSVVAEGRQLANTKNAKGAFPGQRLNAKWADYADGRILSGKEAYELGFVDELGNWEAAVKRTRIIAGLDDADLVTYVPPVDFSNLFGLLGKSEPKSIKVDLGFEWPRLRAGLYYIASSFLH